MNEAKQLLYKKKLQLLYLVIICSSTSDHPIVNATKFYFHSHNFYQKLYFSSVNPVIISPDPGTVYTINEGESIQFECEAYGIPPPMFTFEYEVSMSEEMLARISFPDPGMPSVYIIPATGEEVMLSRGIAILANATDGDSGNYTCVANSTTPESDQVTVTLVVQGTY